MDFQSLRTEFIALMDSDTTYQPLEFLTDDNLCSSRTNFLVKE